MSKCPSVANPEAYLDSQLSVLAEDYALVCFRYLFEQYYLPDAQSVELLVVIECRGSEASRVIVGRWSESFECDALGVSSSQDLASFAAAHRLPCFDLTMAFHLDPIAISKPWGQEIWYTGIEARGQSGVGDGRFSIPLPWLMAVMPGRLSGDLQRSLNLLKILDPLPEEVFGDLYYEQHEEKQEVYVVTHVDSTAWPGGVGGIRMGFNQEILQAYGSSEACKQAFGEAVKAYEAVRRRIDIAVDAMREVAGIALDAPVMAGQQKLWLESIPEELKQQEVQLRSEMDKFKGVRPLAVGDVVKVPCFTPHSLMHGVRTIEFQTPVYERQIISFAQKVLTQDHWDTDAALEKMKLRMPDEQGLPVLRSDPGLLVEQVVDFDSFYVWRVTLTQCANGRPLHLASDAGYALAIGVAGQVNVSDVALGPEVGLFVSNLLLRQEGVIELCEGQERAVFLLSFPKNSSVE